MDCGFGGFGGGLLDEGFDLFDDGVESGGIADGQFGEHLAVQLDAGGDECGDEAVVVDAAGLEGGVEAGDPEGAKVAFVLAAVAIGIYAGFGDEFLGDAVDGTWSAAESGGTAKDAFAFAAMDGAAFYTRHKSLLLS